LTDGIDQVDTLRAGALARGEVGDGVAQIDARAGSIVGVNDRAMVVIDSPE
jgi:hypothetical protein